MPTTTIPTYIVDSFTTEKFKGNPAGVCVLDTPLDETQMLNIANELGFSETAFVSPLPCGGGARGGANEHYQIRFFSPTQEIDLCGHATLASAKILFHSKQATDFIHFKNINDVDLMVSKEHNSDKLLMEFPAYFVEQKTLADVSDKLLSALGLTAEQVLSVSYSKDIHKILIEIASCEELAGLTVDIAKLQASAEVDGVVVTAQSNKAEYDFESRLFAPWIGIDEDPVTGAIHTFLSTYWGKKLGKTKMNAFQCSPRGGSMGVELTGNGTVILQGEAQIVLAGVLNL